MRWVRKPVWTRHSHDDGPRLRVFHFVFGSHFGKALANSGEKSEPASDIDTAAMNSLKALDPEQPIRKDRFDIARLPHDRRCFRECSQMVGCGGDIRCQRISWLGSGVEASQGPEILI